jgi:hypothetical protein
VSVRNPVVLLSVRPNEATHYVIDRVYDANVALDMALPEEADRTFPFNGTLTTVKFQEAKYAKYEQKLNSAYCKDKLQNLPATSIEVVQLAADEAKKLVGGKAPKETK